MIEFRPLEQAAKLLHAHPGVFCDSAHRQGVNRIVTRNRNEMHPVTHDDVLALSQNLESRLFQRPNCLEMINARDLRHP